MNFVLRIAPVAIVMGTIFFLSQQSGDSLHLPIFTGADKVAHMTAYAALAVTVFWFFGKRGLKQKKVTVVWTVCFCLLYGMTDEFHQAFIPSRSVSGWDILADVTGAAIIAALWFFNARIRRNLSVLT